MHDKKKSKSAKSPEQEALEKHVDAMMDPKRPDEPVDGIPTTAPALPTKLRKQITVADVPAPKRKKVVESPAEKVQSEESEKPVADPEPQPEVPPAEEQPAESEAADPTEQSTDLDNDQTDKAVDDITAYESDVVLAVADSTSEEHNREIAAEDAPKGHPLVSTLFWALITLAVILIIAVTVLMVMGDSVATKLGL